MNIAIYTCDGADDGMLSCETNSNGSYTIKATVADTLYKCTYMLCSKFDALKQFRSEVREMCEE